MRKKYKKILRRQARAFMRNVRGAHNIYSQISQYNGHLPANATWPRRKKIPLRSGRTNWKTLQRWIDAKQHRKKVQPIYMGSRLEEMNCLETCYSTDIKSSYPEY